MCRVFLCPRVVGVCGDGCDKSESFDCVVPHHIDVSGDFIVVMYAESFNCCVARGCTDCWCVSVWCVCFAVAVVSRGLHLHPREVF